MSDLAQLIYREWKDKIDKGLTTEDQNELAVVCDKHGITFAELFEKQGR